MRLFIYSLVVATSFAQLACSSDAGGTDTDSTDTSSNSKKPGISAVDTSGSDDAGSSSSSDEGGAGTDTTSGGYGGSDPTSGGSGGSTSGGYGGSSSSGTGGSDSSGSGGSSSGSAGGPSSGTDCGTIAIQDPTMNACFHQNCCAQLLACDKEQQTNNDACMKTIPCTVQCQGQKGDTGKQCVQQCAASKANPPSQAFGDLFNCQQQYCGQKAGN